MARPNPKELLQQARDRFASAVLLRRAEHALVPPPEWAFRRFGAGAVIVPPARVEGAGRISIGERALVHEHAWLMARGDADLSIGSAAIIGRFVKIVCFDSVQIGDGALFADRCYVSDVEYEPGHPDTASGERPLTPPRPVVIGPEACLGIGSVVKPGVTIGARAYIGAAAVVTTDIPEGALAVGAPARVVRRAD